MSNLYRALVTFLCFAFVFDFKLQAADSPPYVYYYSSIENALIIERADGTDKRTIVSDLVDRTPEEIWSISGPGWSPDGHWFSLRIFPQGYPSGLVINVDSGAVEPIQMWNSSSSWSPDSQFLLISGFIQPCEGYCLHQTTWLFDVERNEILAWLDIFRGDMGAGATPIDWDLDNDQVVFYRHEANLGQKTILSSYYRITMRLNGEVLKQPIPSEEYDALFVPDMPSEVSDFTSPSGRVVISSQGELTNADTAAVVQLPKPTLGATIVDAVWDSSEAWMLLTFRYAGRGGDSAVIVTWVVPQDGSTVRELTTCGTSPACVGWLPDVVELAGIAESAG